MPRHTTLPPVLCARPFTVAEATRLGVTHRMLHGPRFRRLFRGVHCVVDLPLDLRTWIAAALLVLPDDAVVSHTTALRLYGIELGRVSPLHFSTNTKAVTRSGRLRLHRRRGRITPFDRDGVALTGPDRTLVDAATCLSLVQLVQAGDWLVHSRATTLDTLTSYAATRHLDGVRRARRAAALVRSGVESPRETVVRLLLVFARLPEPECNREIRSAGGTFLARGDLVYARWKVLVEYDGWQHERDATQRQRDVERRERLEAHGWRVIVVTTRDLELPREVAWRVYRALAARGYEGRAPHFNIMWSRWFL